MNFSKVSARQKQFTISLFGQLVITYLILLFSSYFIFSPLINKTREISRSIYLDETKHALTLSGRVMEDTLKELYQLTAWMDTDIYFQKLKTITLDDHKLLPSASYGSLHVASRNFRTQIGTLEHVEEVFLFLTNLQTVMGRQRTFHKLDEYLSFDIAFADASISEQMKQMMFAKENFQVLSFENVSVYKAAPQDCLIFLMRRPHDSIVIGTVISQRNLADLFGFDRLPENAVLRLMDMNGRELIVLGDSKDEISNTVLDTTISFAKLTVQLQLPEAYFDEMTEPVRSQIHMLQMIVIVVGLILSTLFAIICSKPVHKLAKGRLLKPHTSFVREYRSINHYMATTNAQLQTFQEKLRSNMFLRMLYGSLGAEENQQVKQFLPLINQEYRIAVLHTRMDNSDMEMQFHKEWSEQFPPYFISGQISVSQTALLMPSTQEAENIVRASLGQPTDFFAAIGLSEPMRGKKHLSIALRHAQFSLLHSGTGDVVAYVDDGQQTERPIGLYGIQRLIGYMTDGNHCEALSLLDKIKNALLHEADENSIAQTYYLIRYALETVISDVDLELLSELPEYRIDKDLNLLFEELGKTIIDLSQKINEQKKHVDDHRGVSILQYVNDHYCQWDISANSIAEVMGTNRSEIYKQIREQTGKSLNEYIEYKRMEKALHLLRETDQSVTQISEACGYNSVNTFYKVFKKNFHTAPSSMRAVL